MNEIMTTVQPIGRAWFLDRPVRLFGTPEEPLWMVEEIRPVLGFSAKPARLLQNHPENERLVCLVGTSGQGRQVWFINEPGLYRLIFKSRRPEAEKLKTWVFNEVLPALRRYGRYPASFEGPTPAQIPLEMPEALREWMPTDADFTTLPVRKQITVAERIRAVRQVALSPHLSLIQRCREAAATMPDRKGFSGLTIWRLHRKWQQNDQSWRCLNPAHERSGNWRRGTKETA